MQNAEIFNELPHDTFNCHIVSDLKLNLKKKQQQKMSISFLFV